MERAAGRGVGPCPDLRPEEQSCGGREVGVRWRSGRGSPSRRPELGEGGLHLDAIWIRANTQGHSRKCLRANQTLPEITTKPLKRMSERLRRGMCLRRAGGGEPELGGREEGEAWGPPQPCRHTL